MQRVTVSIGASVGNVIYFTQHTAQCCVSCASVCDDADPLYLLWLLCLFVVPIVFSCVDCCALVGMFARNRESPSPGDVR